MGEPPYFYGHRNPEQHHTTGRRAWSLQHSEWCYPAAPCAGCVVQMAEDDPCPHCHGTGIRPTPDNVEPPVRPMDFANVLDWFERHSSNPLGTPFYSEDTPQMLAEYFAESFGIDCTPENVECP